MTLDYVIAKLRTRVNELEKNKENYFAFKEAIEKKFPDVLFGEFNLSSNNNLVLNAYFLDPDKDEAYEADLATEISSFQCDYFLKNDVENVSMINHFFKDVVRYYLDNVRSLAGDDTADLLVKYQEQFSEDDD